MDHDDGRTIIRAGGNHVNDVRERRATFESTAEHKDHEGHEEHEEQPEGNNNKSNARAFVVFYSPRPFFVTFVSFVIFVFAFGFDRQKLT